MKIKKILILVLIVLTVFLIYLTTLDKKVYYLSIGDFITTGIDNDFEWNDKIVTYLKDKNKFEVYVNSFSKENLRTTDLYNMIDNNEKDIIDKKEKTIKNALIKADLLTLSIGMNDFIYKMGIDKQNNLNELYDYVDEVMLDLDNLLNIIRKYCKEDIIITNYYVPTNLKNENNIKMINYANNCLEELVKQYNIELVDISNYSNNASLFLTNTPFLSTSGNDLIYNQFQEKINNTLFN